jgi:hypothetical protein
MKIKRLLMYLCALLCPVASMAFEMPIGKSRAAHSIMEDIAGCKFDQARAEIDEMLSTDSADPLAWMLLMADIALQQLDYSRSSDADSFQKTYERTKTMMAEYEKRKGADSYFLTIRGISQLIATAYTMHRKRYWSALKMGFNALDLCKEAKKKDSLNVDADFMIGLYGYARAELKRKFLGILFWYSGNKKSGIRLIENCGKNARLIPQVADMVLQEIYVREKMFDKASAGIGGLLELYPGNRFALWTKSKYYDTRSMPDSAAEVYGKLADAYEQIPEAQKNYFATRFLEAKRYFEAKNYQKASEACKSLAAECRGAKDDNCEEGEDLLIKIQREIDPHPILPPVGEK